MIDVSTAIWSIHTVIGPWFIAPFSLLTVESVNRLLASFPISSLSTKSLLVKEISKLSLSS